MTNETQTPSPELLLTPGQLMCRWRISRDTVGRFIRLGLCPRPLILAPRTHRFRLSEIVAAENLGCLRAAERFARCGQSAFWNPESDEPGERTENLDDENETSGTTEK